jgi:hypothetical protein
MRKFWCNLPIKECGDDAVFWESERGKTGKRGARREKKGWK